MNKKKVHPDEVYGLYLRAARELKRNNSIKYAKYFFQKALAYKGVTKNKASVYFSLINMELFENKDARPTLKELNNYLKSNPAMKTKAVVLNVDYYRVITSGEKSEAILSSMELESLEKDQRLWDPLLWHDIAVMVGQKEFKKAQAKIVLFNLEEAPLNQKIVADLLRTKLEPGSVEKRPLYCESSLKKYPESIIGSYTMKLCRILLDIAEKKDRNQNLYSSLQKQISKDFPSEEYLFKALE